MDYKLSRKRIDSFVDALNDALIGWSTCFTVNNTEDPFVYAIEVRDLFWHRKLTFKLNIRYWSLSGFDVNEKVDFQEMLRISNSIKDILESLRNKFSDVKTGE